MKNKELIINEITDYISENKKDFPFLSNFWNIEIISKQNQIEYDITYGHFKTADDGHVPFYKPFSKIIDFNKLNEK